MKLLTHNFLASPVKGVQQGYPFVLIADKFEEREAEFNAEFVARMLPRLNYAVVRTAADSVGLGHLLPPEASDDKDEAFLRALHHVLLEVEVLEGTLVCPETNRRFPIVGGIPNMLLTEDEV